MTRAVVGVAALVTALVVTALAGCTAVGLGQQAESNVRGKWLSDW